jgi:tetratricopeptide (TPR) repeat protein
MTDISTPAAIPPALTAVEKLPLLWQQAQQSLALQAMRIRERTSSFVARPTVVEKLDQAIAKLESGLIRLEGPPGSGVTSLLCHLASTRPYPFWLIDDDAGQGAAGLAAQLIALYNLPVQLIAPAIHNDARILEELLAEAVSYKTDDGPLVILIDAVSEASQSLRPIPVVFPFQLPKGVIVVYGCNPANTTPLAAAAQVSLDQIEETLDLSRLEGRLPSSQNVRQVLFKESHGNFLYLRFVEALIQNGLLKRDQLPPDLESLHRLWWKNLDELEKRFAVLLAASGEPLPHDLCCELLGADPSAFLRKWKRFIQITELESEEEQVVCYSLYHSLTRSFLSRQARKQLTDVHGQIAALVQEEVLGDRPRDVLRPISSQRSWYAGTYLLNSFARHSFWGPLHVRTSILPVVAGRPWVRLQQRHGTAISAAQDVAWELWGAIIDGSLGRLARSTFLAGSLATLARSLPTDAPADALTLMLDTPERDAVLKRILAICEQLPDGREKAALLRRLGEVCYVERRMRTTAMRLLSQAIDLEAQVPSKAWRDGREQLLMTLALSTLAEGHWKEALEIVPLISHTERRGMVETEVVRRLILQHDLARAELVAHAIIHDNMRAWAQAEIAVAQAQSDDFDGAESLLANITLETANAWANIEIACYEARSNEEAAKRRISQLSSMHQQDRGRARLAQALAQFAKDGDALTMAEQIEDVAERVTALLGLRLSLEGLVAMLALEQATAVISSLTGDDRVPLIAALAEAHAALGRSERAISIINELEADEERDRALARVAVALAESGDYDQGQQVIANLSDPDERDWSLTELARLLAQAGRWDEAYQSGHQITDELERAKCLVELALDQARQGDVVRAYNSALEIEPLSEQARALTALVPLLVSADQKDLAFQTQDLFASPDIRSRYQTALVTALLEHTSSMPAQQAAAIWADARKLALTISRPTERVRALIALAQHTVDQNPVLAQSTLGLALRTSSSNRQEALRCLEWAAPILVRLGGARLMVDVASAIDDIDTWLLA